MQPSATRAPRPRRGGHAVEFAMIMPIWVMLVSGIMDLGWFFFNVALLDAASDVGCRAGSLYDPGIGDARIGAVKAKAIARMSNVVAGFGVGNCDSCRLEVYTRGRPPNRVLICELSRDIVPFTGMFYQARRIESKQIARLEWQREAAPE